MFSISQGFKLKLSKEGDDGLAVKDIVIDAGREECGSFLLFDVGCHIAQSERSGTKTSYFTDLEEGCLSNLYHSFSCGSFHLGDSASKGRTYSRQTNKCKVKVGVVFVD